MDSILRKLVRNGCVVVSGIESHIERKFAESLLNLLQDHGNCVGVIDVRGSDVRVDNDIVSAVYGSVLAVVESVRFAFFVQLPAVRESVSEIV